MDDFDLFRSQMLQRKGGSHRILLGAQVADHRNAKASVRRRMTQLRVRGLVDHARLAPDRAAELAQRRFLQHDDAVGELQGLAGIGGTRQVAVQVGAGQHDDQPFPGAFLPEPHDRAVAAARVQGDQRVARLALPLRDDAHAVACAAQQRCPAQRRMAVAAARACGRGSHDDDALHINSPG